MIFERFNSIRYKNRQNIENLGNGLSVLFFLILPIAVFIICELYFSLAVTNHLSSG